MVKKTSRAKLITLISSKVLATKNDDYFIVENTIAERIFSNLNSSEFLKLISDIGFEEELCSKKEFGFVIFQIRTTLGLSQTAMSEVLGISQSDLSFLENGGLGKIGIKRRVSILKNLSALVSKKKAA